MSVGGSLRRRLGPNAVRVVVIAALVILVGVVLLIVTGSTRGTYELKAVFDDVRGLIPGGEVRAGAIDVGRVTQVRLNGEDQPEVTMRIDNDFVLHEGAVANIRLGSNVGAVNRTVDLTQGDVTAARLAPGTTLDLASTAEPVNFDLAVQTLDPPTRANIRSFLIGLDQALTGRGPDFDRTLANSSRAVNELANLIAQVNTDGQALRTLVVEGDRVTSALAGSPQDLGESVVHAGELLDTTARRQAELGRSLRLMGPAFDNGRETLEKVTETAPTLDRLATGLQPVVDRLEPLARRLPATVRAADPFLTQTRKLVRGGPRALRRIDPIIRGAEPIATDFPPVIEAAIPLAKDLTAYVPETIGFFQNFGTATGSYDRNGHLVNLGFGLAQTPPSSTTSRTLTGADCGAGALELPFTRLPGVAECKPWRDFETAFDDLDPTQKDGGG